ncbi:trypsin-like peptidase domain-containing protein [Streptomyces sp. NA02950]|uniref:S1C family serine protease n=1 Tax=Streptomyces sp. NA02950 TaxID=2742137 RepID=UPI001591BF61|nr:trypsin-like peptidase domain-containing protein [Streptomyces sp. NA02950]QKV92717.1 trypsin-like peptidase domain-containing protein [Streptomyces sp. NA02950]
MDERKASGPKPKPKWWSRPAARPGDDRPTAAAEETPATAEETAGAADETAGQDGGPAAERASGAGETAAAAAAAGTAGPGGEPEDAVPPAEPPTRPLHEPDPYGTPPYGGPGPWAPAPPVQHPVATPGHGTHVPPGATPGHGTHVPPGATPGHGTHVPPGATPGHGTHVPPGATPGHGTQLPPGAAAVPPQAAPAPLPHPGMTPPHGTQLPPSAGETTAPLAPLAPAAPQAAHWRQYDPWSAPRPPAGPRMVTRRRAWIAVLLIALIAGCLGGAIGGYLEHDRATGGGDVELPQAPVDSEPRARGSIAGIAARALPSVVTIHVRGGSAEGTGTGFVLDNRGHILTNNHVVEPAGTGGDITVTFNGGHTADAEVIGRDAGYDLAVIKVEGVTGLRPLPLGNSDSVRVGDPVVAIGAPFDLEGTVTSGIISAKERPITAGGEKGDGSDVSYVDALQTDAPINPGNSGGPLVDGKARVIGINSAIRAADDGSELGGQGGSIGLGFAIPINQGKRVAEELINTGKATHPVIGVTLDMEYQGDGARVNTKGVGGPPVKPGGPGDDAGIEAGDVITAVDGVRVHSAQELIVKIRSHRPGDRLELTLKRGDDKRSVELSLGSASSEG